MTTKPSVRAEILRNGRLKKSLTLEAVAEKFGVHRSTVMRWEKGTITHINLAILRELAKLYKIPLSQISDCDDETDSDNTLSELNLTKEEAAIITAYRNACKTQKECMELYAESISGKVS